MSTASPSSADPDQVAPVGARASATQRRVAGSTVLAIVSLVLGGIAVIMHALALWLGFGMGVEAMSMVYPFMVVPLAGILSFVALVLAVIALVRAALAKGSVWLPLIALVVAVVPAVIVVVFFQPSF